MQLAQRSSHPLCHDTARPTRRGSNQLTPKFPFSQHTSLSGRVRRPLVFVVAASSQEIIASGYQAVIRQSVQERSHDSFLARLHWLLPLAEGLSGNDLLTKTSQSRTTLFSATWSRLATTSAPLQSWLCAIVTRFVLDHSPHC